MPILEGSIGTVMGSSISSAPLREEPPPLPSLPPPLPSLQEMAHRATSYLIFKTKPPIGESETMPAMINPDTLQERVRASYPKGNVLGLSHQSIQYTFTESRTMPIELHISAGVLVQKGWTHLVPDLMRWKKFFQSLLVPTALGLAPPRVRVIWPQAKLAFTGVVESLDVTYEVFAPSGQPLAYVLAIEFLETAQRLMTSDRVRLQGLGSKAYGE